MFQTTLFWDICWSHERNAKSGKDEFVKAMWLFGITV
jgi:hypothetical protein